MSLDVEKITNEINNNIILLDKALRSKYNVGFSYGTEDRLFDFIFEELITKENLFEIEKETK
jgi:hypothetical protein